VRAFLLPPVGSGGRHCPFPLLRNHWAPLSPLSLIPPINTAFFGPDKDPPGPPYESHRQFFERKFFSVIVSFSGPRFPCFSCVPLSFLARKGYLLQESFRAQGGPPPLPPCRPFFPFEHVLSSDDDELRCPFLGHFMIISFISVFCVFFLRPCRRKDRRWRSFSARH